MTNLWPRCADRKGLTRRRCCSGRQSGSLTQNTSVPGICVRYAFHPLAGRRFRPVRRCEGPPATFEVHLSDGLQLHIPVWMTEPTAARMRLVQSPQVGVESLLVLASFVEKLELAPALAAKERPSRLLDQEGPRGEAKAARARSSRRNRTGAPSGGARDKAAARCSSRESAAAGPPPRAKRGGEP
jgi:hypothetical protein